MGGSITAAATVILAAFGLFWLGLALHWALLPELGPVWAWLIPGALYLLLALGAALAVLRTASASAPAKSGPGAAPPFPVDAGKLGMELGRELEREVRQHPLRAVSIAMVGGAVLGASPELRRGLFSLFPGPHSESRPRTASESRF